MDNIQLELNTAYEEAGNSAEIIKDVFEESTALDPLETTEFLVHPFLFQVGNW